MQQSVKKPLWVRGGSLSHGPNLEGISEFQLPVKIMSSKHANTAVMCSVLEPCLPQLSRELGVYAPFGGEGIWHPFYRKLGQLTDTALHFLHLLCWPCNIVIKYTRLMHVLIILDGEGRLWLRLLCGDSGSFSPAPALSLYCLWPWSRLMWLPLHKVLTPSKMKSHEWWKLLVFLLYR